MVNSYRATTFFGAENSEVPSTPVAVMFCPSRIAFFVERLKEASPDPSVETVTEPSKVLPSSPPPGLEKNSTLKASSGTLFSVPLTVVAPVPPLLAEERTGLF